jgi:hypothetical protein
MGKNAFSGRQVNDKFMDIRLHSDSCKEEKEVQHCKVLEDE